jgi:CubicO group peptidase (beta-lactamase class C family)
VIRVFAAVLLLVFGQGPSAPRSEDDVKRDVEKLFKGFSDTSLFSGSVLVAHGDRVLFNGATGPANLEFGAMNTPETRFRVAGLSQMFTVAALLRLQEMGKLDVKDPAGKHMSGWPEAYKAITIHQLLTGASGVKDVTQMPDFVKTIAVPRDTQELADLIVKEPVTTSAGRGRANNSDFHLLAAIIERAAGLSFSEFVRREVIERAGLRQTSHDAPAEIIPNRAVGYTRVPEGYRHAAWFHMNNAVGMANLLSTTADMHRFIRALVAGRIISKPSLELMTTSHIPPPDLGGGARGSGVGYGINITPAPVVAWVSGGSINGFSANFWYDPAQEWLVLVFSNVGNSSASSGLLNSALAIVGGRPFTVPEVHHESPARAGDLAAVAGSWEVGNSFAIVNGQRQANTLSVRVDGHRLFVRTVGSGEWEWFSEGAGRFFARHVDAQIILKDGSPDEAEYVLFGRKSTLKRQSR